MLCGNSNLSATRSYGGSNLNDELGHGHRGAGCYGGTSAPSVHDGADDDRHSQCQKTRRPIPVPVPVPVGPGAYWQRRLGHSPDLGPAGLGTSPRLACAPLVLAFAGRIRKALGRAQGGADHGSTRMSIFRGTSSGRSGVTVLMAGILSSSPRTRPNPPTIDTPPSCSCLRLCSTRRPQRPQQLQW